MFDYPAEEAVPVDPEVLARLKESRARLRLTRTVPRASHPVSSESTRHTHASALPDSRHPVFDGIRRLPSFAMPSMAFGRFPAFAMPSSMAFGRFGEGAIRPWMGLASLARRVPLPRTRRFVAVVLACTVAAVLTGCTNTVPRVTGYGPEAYEDFIDGCTVTRTIVDGKQQVDEARRQQLLHLRLQRHRRHDQGRQAEQR